MSKKWIYDRLNEKLVPIEEYRPPESKFVAPEWVNSTPIRGHWRLVKDANGNYGLVDVKIERGEWDCLFVHDDSIELEHPATGEIVTSKAKFYELDRKHDLVYVGKRERKVRDYVPSNIAERILEAKEKLESKTWREQESQRQAWEKEHPDKELEQVDQSFHENLAELLRVSEGR